jgi:hypothetical protein
VPQRAHARVSTLTKQPNRASILLIKQEFISFAVPFRTTNQLALWDEAEWTGGSALTLPESGSAALGGGAMGAAK